MAAEPIIELKNICVTFKEDKRDVHAVDHVDLSVDRGDIYGVVGYSGAGKSTLIRVINLLQRPTNADASVKVNGTDLLGLDASKLRGERRKIGMIFQHFNLMQSLSIADNVDFALKKAHLSKADRKKRVAELLELVGLTDKADDYPAQLSGGQKQRVGIARALANRPDILISDEATSALDPKTTVAILDLLADLNRKLGLTVVLITHEMDAVKRICNRVAVMEAGRLVETGDLLQIFSQPEAPLTKDFIDTTTHLESALAAVNQQAAIKHLQVGSVLVQLGYQGESTDQPLITELYRRFEVSANILYGNLEILQGTPVGNLLVILSGTPKHTEQALVFMKEQRVSVKVLKSGTEEVSVHD
ncbi:methionine ABC transporter ATP-binding protein [Lapidilactobacillus luobeiensis]|uniref:methionine ABC transporter ATP-binding protein n=1 Tax=Lapidilactobacillus luobeiensis TaxID=2950371 RepID=UPI0021C3AA33|nr:ATP-binding cassette domain-containing protein [Lapidilactobacillus luobeiensis]